MGRGGKVVFQDIAKPSSMEWGSPVDALEAALELEKTVNQSLLDMHKASDGDAHLCDFIEGEFLGEQVDAIKEISVWITKRREPDLELDSTSLTKRSAIKDIGSGPAQFL